MNWIVTLAVIVVAINVTESLEQDDDNAEVITIYPHDGEDPDFDEIRASMTPTSDLMRIRLGGHQTSRKRRDAGEEIIEFATPQKEIDRYLARKKKEMQRIENEKELTRILLDNNKDEDYSGKMSIGHPPKDFRMNFDTGSALTWVFSESCTDIACLNHRRYDSSKSRLYKPDGRSNKVTYETGYARGYMSKDVVRMGGMRTPFTFLEANETSTFKNAKFDGVCGLGYSKDGSKTLLDLFQEQGYIRKAQFCFKMNSITQTDQGGELVIGGVDPAHHVGRMRFFKVTKLPHWHIQMERISVPGFNIKLCENGCGLIIDTGCTLLNGPYDEIARLHKEVFNDAILHRSGRYILHHHDDMKKFPDIGFVLIDSSGQKVMFTLKPIHYIQSVKVPDGRVLYVTGFGGVSGKDWIFGDTILRRYYPCFDKDNHEVGLAAAANYKPKLLT